MNREIIDTIRSEGMIKTGYDEWKKITCTISIYNETEKAVHGMVSVTIDGKNIYTPAIYWVPKQLMQKPHYICKQLFNEEERVSNKVWC